MSQDQTATTSSNPPPSTIPKGNCVEEPPEYVLYVLPTNNNNGQNEVPQPDVMNEGIKAQNDQLGHFSGLEDKTIRRGFIRKVYLLLLLQLSITFGIIAIFHFVPWIGTYVRSPSGGWLYFASYTTFLVIYIVIVCSKDAARKFPLNIILLTILTLSMSYMMGMISAFYNTKVFVTAAGMTLFICFGICLFSLQTKFDLTTRSTIIVVLVLTLLAFCIILIFDHSIIMHRCFAIVGALIFSIFLAVDTQLILGGKRYEINAEDHIYASLMLYLDIIYIFMYIMTLFGSRK